jgi:signal transduction histidine kinase
VHASIYNLGRDLRKFKEFLLELAGDDADDEIVAVFDEKFDALLKHTSTMQDGTNRIKKIVMDLLSFSRLDSVGIRLVKLTEELSTTINLVKVNYRHHVDFVRKFESELEIPCCAAELNQVFLNVMVNACQAIVMKQEETGDEEKGTLTIQTMEDDNFVLVKFRDTGVGMSEEIKRKMFEPFFTTKPVGDGTGLGLSISFGIIEKHQGRFEVTSEEGKSTTVSVYLPKERAE